jgi:hypothetical protein
VILVFKASLKDAASRYIKMKGTGNSWFKLAPVVEPVKITADRCLSSVTLALPFGLTTHHDQGRKSSENTFRNHDWFQAPAMQRVTICKSRGQKVTN